MDEVNKRDLSIGAPTGLFSKALRDTSKTIKVSSLRGLGLREDSLWNEIMGTCVDLATSNAEAVEQQLSFAGVHYKEGFASFRRIGPDGSIDSVNVDGEEVYGKNFLIATGSKPFRPKGVPFDGARVFDSDTINTLGFLPKSVAITGSGIIAIEYAKIFKNLGCDVTVLIRSDQPRDALMKIGLDKDVASALIADLVRSGINLARGVEMARMDVPANPSAPLAVTLVGAKDKQPRGTLTCDAYLAAVGRSPNTEKLNLAEAGIALDEYGGVLVNSLMATSARGGNVYAAGDVVGRPFLAATGAAQGNAAVRAMFAAERAAGAGTPFVSARRPESFLCDDALCVDPDLSRVGTAYDPVALAANPFAFPVGVWSSPEVAYYGLSAQQAAELGIEADEALALYSECTRGRVFSPEGLLKLVFERESERLLGVHICGQDACELVHYGMELIKGRRTLVDVRTSVCSEVTYHQLYRLAAEAAEDPAGARRRRAAAGRDLAARRRAGRRGRLGLPSLEQQQ